MSTSYSDLIVHAFTVLRALAAVVIVREVNTWWKGVPAPQPASTVAATTTDDVDHHCYGSRPSSYLNTCGARQDGLVPAEN